MESFKRIANNTGGKVDYLDVSKKTSIDMLTIIFLKTVLNELNGDKLKKEYDKKYCY